MTTGLSVRSGVCSTCGIPLFVHLATTVHAHVHVHRRLLEQSSVNPFDSLAALG